MMGKPSKRPGRAARGDVHARIQEEAAAVRSVALPGLRHAEEMPALAALMASAKRHTEAALSAALTTSFMHEARPYFVRVGLVMQLEIFDTAGAAAPLVRGMTPSLETFGHAPGH